MKIKEIIHALEAELPLWMQEAWDNSGLQLGDVEQECTGALLCLDIHEAIIEEARAKQCNLIVAHHPLLFKGLKQITPLTYIERCVTSALKHDMVIYAAHTNADNAPTGLNYTLAEELGMINIRPLAPIKGLQLLTVFVPTEYLVSVQQALWDAGAGKIGSYDCCSYSSSGRGTFRALDGANPFIGDLGELHHEAEERLSVVLPSAISYQVVSALLASHPYEMPAYELTELENPYPYAGSGVVADLIEPMSLETYIPKLKAYFFTKQLRHSRYRPKAVRRVAICSGAGAFLVGKARAMGADVFITGEAKYNDYFDAERITLVTVGHYESELVSTRVFAKAISRKFPNFAVQISNLDINPIVSI